jgi:hypothetical protein
VVVALALFRTDRINLHERYDHPYVRYDKLPQIDTAAVVENKRLDHALRAAQAIQAQRDDRRCTPSRTNQGQPPRPRTAVPGTSNSRQFNVQDFEQALRKACKSMTPLSRASTTATRPSKAR